MRKYTVFLHYDGDQPLWAQVKATGRKKAVDEARRRFAQDFADNGDPLDEGGSAEEFPLLMVVDGWPKFKLEV